MKNVQLDQSKLLGFKILIPASLDKAKILANSNVKLGAKIGSVKA